MPQNFGIDASVLTYEDYRNAPDDERYELLDGELVMIAAPNVAHQKALFRMARLVEDFVLERGLGGVFIAPTDVVLSDTNVVQPDVIFVSKGRMSVVGDANIQGAPDLVVEIVSPSNPERDLIRKRDIYARHGVREYWIADPITRLIRVMVLDGNGYRLVGEFGEGDLLESGALEGIGLEVRGAFSAPGQASGQGA